jgi:hypothetical protein
MSLLKAGSDDCCPAASTNPRNGSIALLVLPIRSTSNGKVGQCLQIQSTWPYNRLVGNVIAANRLVRPWEATDASGSMQALENLRQIRALRPVLCAECVPESNSPQA